MKKSVNFKFCIVVLLVCFAVSCQVVFDVPIFSAKDSKIDKRLLGKWRSDEPNAKSGVVEILKKSDAEIEIIAPDDETGAPTVVFRAFVGKLGNADYLNLWSPKETEKGFLIARYEIQNEYLTIRILDDEKIKEALKKNQLKGYAKPGTIGDVIIDDSAKNVKNFLKSPLNDEIFEPAIKLKKAE